MDPTICPNCGNQVILPRGSDLQQAKCPHCQGVLSASAAGGAAPASPAAIRQGVQTVVCPGCQSELRVPPSATQAAKCPQCGTVISLAPPAAVVLEPPVLQSAETVDEPMPIVTLADDPAPRKPLGQRMSPTLWYGILAGLLVGVLVAIFLFAARSEGAP